jgi:RNA polymerase sigma-70 factor, ECF subfamily
MDNGTLDSKDMLETSEDFEAAYHAHAGSIYKFLFWRTKNVQVSEDLTSTTFQKAWAARGRFKDGSVQAWLYRIARNTLFDYWRKQKELVSDELAELQADGEPSTPELLDKQFELELLEKAMAKLPASMKAIVELRFTEGLSSKQVARQLGTSEGNVRIMQYRALKRLKEYLQ